MDWAPQALVIILSIFLALFLRLSIALTIIVIKITRQIKTITTVAERTVVKMEETASNASTFTSPLFLARFVKNFMKNSKK